jgi:hypothetical protein
MQTVTELLRTQADRIQDDGRVLLVQHSAIKRHPPPPRRDTIVFIRTGQYYWEPLSVEGQRLASKIRREFGGFEAVVGALLRTEPGETQYELKNLKGAFLSFLEQNDDHSYPTGDAAHAALREVMNDYLALIQNLYSQSDEEHIYVPDTNALVANPALDEWAFDQSPNFVMVLTPTVLSELDKLKVTGRAESVRDKAQRLIRQLKEFRRRGDLREGVTLRKNRSRVRTIAVEPDFANTLPWLQPDNADDRILATFVEVMRAYPRCPVILVTEDINMMNKADCARLPCVEPPEPL